jgi:hypothetical protein
MPKPVPPPPPQPSSEETRAAVRFVRVVMVAAVAVFLLVASTYGPDNFFLDYGRSETATWNVWRARNLDMDALRAHPGGRITWVVGSSILRDSFDEEAINSELNERGSPWRIRKFGFTRGAPGLSAGLLEDLPVLAGDRVVTSVSVENFGRDWESATGPPADVMMKTLPRSEFWKLTGWSLPQKLEQASAIPWDFYRFHDETADGVWAWIEKPLWNWRAPRKARRKWMLRYNRGRLQTKELERGRLEGASARIYIGAEGLDFSSDQMHIRGLERYAEFCETHEVELRLVDIPPRQEYLARFVHETARAQWDAWRAGQTALTFFPQLPEDHFYDWKHPVEAGRDRLSSVLVAWLDAPFRGTLSPVTWPSSDYNVAPPRSEATP